MLRCEPVVKGATGLGTCMELVVQAWQQGRVRVGMRGQRRAWAALRGAAQQQDAQSSHIAPDRHWRAGGAHHRPRPLAWAPLPAQARARRRPAQRPAGSPARLPPRRLRAADTLGWTTQRSTSQCYKRTQQVCTALPKESGAASCNR